MPTISATVVFVNYRRDDSGWAANAVADALRRRMTADGVFLDNSSISLGRAFAQEIVNAVERSTVVLSLIGPTWDTPAMLDRLADPEDWVRRELLLAQERSIRTIPVLVDRDNIPDNGSLPAELQFLTGLQTAQLRQTHKRDIDELVDQIMDLLPEGVLASREPLTGGNGNDRVAIDDLLRRVLPSEQQHSGSRGRFVDLALSVLTADDELLYLVSAGLVSQPANSAAMLITSTSLLLVDIDESFHIRGQTAIPLTRISRVQVIPTSPFLANLLIESAAGDTVELNEMSRDQAVRTAEELWTAGSLRIGSDAHFGVNQWSAQQDPEFEHHWGPRSRGVTVAADRGDRFKGRVAALSAINSWLIAERLGPRILAITGSPGVGKSALLGRVLITSDAIACAIHAKGKTASEVATELAAAAGIPQIDNTLGIVTAVRAVLESKIDGASRFNIVIDALDEAHSPVEARAIALDLLIPLVETCQHVGLQVIVGSRKRDDEGDILRSLGPGLELIDLDDSAYFEIDDLVAYSLATLQLDGDDSRQSVYRDATASLPAAERIAHLAAPNFLVAGLMARSYGIYDQVPATADQIFFTGSVDDAFRRYLSRVPNVGTFSAVDLLGALAIADRPGLPLELWQLALRAIMSDVVPDRKLLEFSRSAGANFLLESSRSSASRTFMLYHQALNECLLRWIEELGSSRKEIEQRWTSELLDYGRFTGWSSSPPYLLQSLPGHARRAEMIDSLLNEDEYILHADLARLLLLTRN